MQDRYTFFDLGGILMEGYIGEVRLFAGTYAPLNWAFCEGQVMAIADNMALFSILGAQFGGDGRTTFALPKLDPVKSEQGVGVRYIICLNGIYPSRD